MSNPIPVLKWLNSWTGNYDAFDANSDQQMANLNQAYYEIDFQDSLNTKVYVSYLLGSENGLSPNKIATDAEFSSVISRYNNKQDTLKEIKNSMIG